METPPHSRLSAWRGYFGPPRNARVADTSEPTMLSPDSFCVVLDFMARALFLAEILKG